MDPRCSEDPIPASGIRCWDLGTATWALHKDQHLYKTLIRWEWLVGVCVPYVTPISWETEIISIRCSKVEVLDKLE